MTPGGVSWSRPNKKPKCGSNVTANDLRKVEEGKWELGEVRTGTDRGQARVWSQASLVGGSFGSVPQGAPKMGPVTHQTCPSREQGRCQPQPLVKEHPWACVLRPLQRKWVRTVKKAALPLRDAGADCLEWNALGTSVRKEGKGVYRDGGEALMAFPHPAWSKDLYELKKKDLWFSFTYHGMPT